jgi:DmsE family decaheme c-type cytochrome
MSRSESVALVRGVTRRAAGAGGSAQSMNITKILFMFALVAIEWCFLSGWARPAQAQDAASLGSTYTALRDYIQTFADGDAQPGGQTYDHAAAVAAHDSMFRQGDDHAAFAVLRDFAQQLPSHHPVLATSGSAMSGPATSGEMKVADADNLFDALKEFLQKQNGTAPPEQPTAPPPKPAKHVAPLIAATYVGTKVCLGCHTGQAGPFGYTEMGRLETQGKMQCETCHGPGSEHVRLGGGVGVGGIISFRTDDTSRTAEQNNAICLSCHERGERTMWEGSPHEERGLSCSSCHTVMKNVSAKFQLKTPFEPDTCFQCHKDKRAQMMMSAHMPVDEGKMVCSDCHNPHGSFTEAMLRTDTINDTCYKCHAEKRGPFLFEHEPVRENCLNCHDPHGSVNEFMLKISTPRLCFECHTIGPHGPLGMSAVPGSDLAMGRACLDCHTQVHGSNSPAGGAFER